MITADIHIEELLEKYPQANRFLMKRGIICVQCGETYWGTLGELIKDKGLDEQSILTDLNRVLGDS